MNTNHKIFCFLSLATARSVDRGLGKTSTPQLCFEEQDTGNFSGDIKLVGDIDGDGRIDLVLDGSPKDGLSYWRWPDLQRTLIAFPAMSSLPTEVWQIWMVIKDIDLITTEGQNGLNLIWFENPSYTKIGGTPQKLHSIAKTSAR